MTKAELIMALRNCSDGMCSLCPYDDHKLSTKGCEAKLMRDAADALEAAEKRIAVSDLLSKQGRNCSMKIKVTELPKKPTDCLFCGRVWKFDENGCRESWECEIGGICRNTAECTKLELEARLPKEAHWVAIHNGMGVCSNCNRQDRIDNLATHCRYCGAKMRTVTDCHHFEEGER